MNGLGNIQALRSAISHGQTLLDEQRSHTNPKGHKVVVLASVAPVRTSGGVVLGAVEVLRDVTQLRLLEERMQHQKRMAALGEMATSVAHEIRNPLGTIEGFARLLKSDLERDRHTDHARLAGKIIEGAQNLNYVITNLLTYARPMSVQYEPFDAASLFNSVGDMLTGLAEQARVRIDFRLPNPPMTIHGDIRHLRQVLVNLGRNAIEASRRDGEVIMEVVLRRREVVFSVTDSGCGIGPEDLPRVFDPFFTRKEGGTGLGLSLCHKIVAAHGGEISISSVMNQGTTVKVVLSQLGGEK
jgi:signal transduction histidine kinase